MPSTIRHPAERCPSDGGWTESQSASTWPTPESELPRNFKPESSSDFSESTELAQGKSEVRAWGYPSSSTYVKCLAERSKCKVAWGMEVRSPCACQRWTRLQNDRWLS